MFRWFLLFFFLAAVIVGLVVGVLNPQTVNLDLLAFNLSFPLGALVLTALVAGILLGLVLAAVLFVLPARLARRGRAKVSAETGMTDQSNA
jgi:uncharacterized integral membrane protein